MMTSTKRAVTAAALLAFVQGCSLFESSEGDSKDNVVAVQGGGGATGSGGAGAAAGGAGGAAPATCNGLAGPLMVLLQSPSGIPYCIDRTEVTQADYALVPRRPPMSVPRRAVAELSRHFPRFSI